MTEINTKWREVFSKVTASKETSRVAVPQGTAHELIGVDGSLHGGLRPLSGMKRIYELDFYAHQLHDETSYVNDHFPVNFRIGSSAYGFGIVYRAIRSRRLGAITSDVPSTVSNTSLTGSHSFSTGQDLGSSTSAGNPTGLSGLSDVFIDFWNSATDAVGTFGHVGEILIEDVDPTAQMDVQVFGRLIYVFIRGRDPMLFYVDAIEAVAAQTSQSSSSLFGTEGLSTSSGTSGNAASYEVKKVGRTSAGPFPGPGRQPTLVSPHQATPLGQLQVPGNAVLYKRPAVGQIVLTLEGPASSGLFNATPPGGISSESGWGSTSIEWPTSDGMGSVGTEITSSSQSSSAQMGAYSDPTSACMGTLTTGGLSSAGAVDIIAGVSVYTPFTTTNGPKYPGGLLDRPKTQAVKFQLYDQAMDPFGTEPNATHKVKPHPGSTAETYVQICFCSLDEYIADPSVLDTPIVTLQYSATSVPVGRVRYDGMVEFYPHNLPKTIEAGTTYLWGARCFNNSTPCGFVVGNFDEAIAGSQDIPANITEAEFITKIGGKFKWRTIDAVDGGSASSSDPGAAIGKFDANRFEPGDYTFGYILYDSKTGRKSAYSEVAQVREELFSTGLTSERSEDVASHYIVLEMGYDPTKFDQAYVYRSVKVQDAGGTFVASIVHLDAIIKLADYQTNKNVVGETWGPDSTTYRHVCYWYRLEDKQLVFQDTYLDKSTFDEGMPKGGAALMYRGTMLVSRVQDSGPSTADEKRPEDGIRGIGEMRFSALTDISPELFPPSNRFVPSIPTNEMITIRKTGNNAIGFSQDRLYHIRKEGIYLSNPQEMHEGQGIINQNAVDAVGSALFYVTQTGLKSVNTLGELDSIRALDSLIIRQWAGHLTNVSVAYDPTMSALFVHNPDLEHTVILWFNTGMMTELVDMVFTQVKRGSWPSTFTDYRSTLTERVLFLQNAPVSTGVTGFKPRIFVVDKDHERVISGSAFDDGAVRNTLLDILGDGRLTTNATVTSSTQVSIDPASGSFGQRVEGAYLYCLDSPTPSYIGKKAKIKIASGGGTAVFLTSATSDLLGLPAGSRVGVSPVYFRWVGANLALTADDGTQFGGPDFHRVRQIESIGCSFVDVSGPPVGDEVSSSSSGVGDGTTDAKYQVLAYKGTSTTPSATGFPHDNAGNIIASIAEFEAHNWGAFGDREDPAQARHGMLGTSISPGIAVFCPDLDFRLLSVIVEGRILDTMMSQRPR